MDKKDHAESNPVADKAQKGTKRAKSGKRIWVIAAAVVLCAALVPAGIYTVNRIRYTSAAALLDSGEYEEARDGFLALRDFDDSEEQADYCQSMLDYITAQELMDDGEYESARDMFLALGRFKHSRNRAEQCQTMLDYLAAKELMQSREFEAAEQAFLGLGDFEDSEALAAECNNERAYTEATSLMENGEYAAAGETFGQIGGYKDAQDKAQYCRNKGIYLEAEDAFNNGLYYTAYLAFDSIYDFEDAAERMQQCVIPFPMTGEVYHNDSYWHSLCDLTIKTSSDDSAYNYLKIYTADDVLVSCIAILGGESTKIRLPAGLYCIKTSYGYGNWYGEKEMFGDDGVYQILSIGGTDIFEFNRNYIYTLTLRTESVDSDDAVDSRNVDREGF